MKSSSHQSSGSFYRAILTGCVISIFLCILLNQTINLFNKYDKPVDHSLTSSTSSTSITSGGLDRQPANIVTLSIPLDDLFKDEKGKLSPGSMDNRVTNTNSISNSISNSNSNSNSNSKVIGSSSVGSNSVSQPPVGLSKAITTPNSNYDNNINNINNNNNRHQPIHLGPRPSPPVPHVTTHPSLISNNNNNNNNNPNRNHPNNNNNANGANSNSISPGLLSNIVTSISNVLSFNKCAEEGTNNIMTDSSCYYESLIAADRNKEPFKMSKEICKLHYGNRKYFPESEMKLPPMFYTFPGSGNTWGRLLIEYGTGIYTGSVYNDKSLLTTLPGEFTCNRQVSVVKVHPHTHDFARLRDGGFQSDGPGKCQRGNVPRFKRAVLLIRDPYDSIWSEYQRRVTQSHVDGVLRESFDWHRWQANTAALSHKYYEMWHIEYMEIERSFRKADILYVRYEDLKNHSRRFYVMKQIADFIGVKVSDDQLQCSFKLAENKKAHRNIDPDVEMTKQDAYLPEINCRMWALFGKYASTHGYTPFGNYPCSKDGPYPAIPQINVGPQGEYNNMWVTPGQRKVDFRNPSTINRLNQKAVDTERAAIESQQESRMGMMIKSGFVKKFDNIYRPSQKKIQTTIQTDIDKNHAFSNDGGNENDPFGLSIDAALSVRGIAKVGEHGSTWEEGV